jgi:hypothetical protein
MPWDYPGDSDDKFCNQCKKITRHTCFRGSINGTIEWCCDDCGKKR